MAKIRTAAARKYHQSDSESHKSSDDDDSIAKSSNSRPGPKSSKRKSDRNSNSSNETPRRGRGRPSKTATKTNGRSKSNVADSSEDEAPVANVVTYSDSDNDTPIKSKPGPKSKKLALAKEPTPRGRGRPPKIPTKTNDQPKSKPNEKSDDEAEASNANGNSDDDVPIKMPKTIKRSSARHSTPLEPSRKSRRSIANDNNDNDKSKDAEASSDDDSSKNNDQSDDTPTKTPTKVTKRKADSSTAEKRSRDPRANWSKKPKTKDEDRYEVEDILDHKVEDGRKYFLIRWKGYGPEVDSWEKHHTISCQALLTKYYEKHPDARLPVKPRNKRKKVVLLPIRPLKIDEQVDYDSDNWNKDEDYEVEKVMDVRIHRDGKRDFLIRWKGYSSNSDTWEPEEHLNCEDLIQKFMEKLERIKNVTHKELRPVRAPTKRFTLMAQSDARRLSKRHDGRQRAVYYECDE